MVLRGVLDLSRHVIFIHYFHCTEVRPEGSGLLKYGTQDDMAVNGQSGTKPSSACLRHLSSLPSIFLNID